MRGGGRCLDGGDGDEPPVRDDAGGGVDEACNEEREERHSDEHQRLVAREAPSRSSASSVTVSMDVAAARGARIRSDWRGIPGNR